MRGLPFTKFSPVGLDVGSHSFKAVQLVKSLRKWEVASSVSLPRLTPGAPLAVAELRRLKEVLDRRGFAGSDIVVAVPSASLLTAILELPARAPGLPMEQIASDEFARVHKHAAAQLTMSAWELPAPARASKATYMLAVGAVSAELESHIDLIEAENFNVLAMEEPYSASARGCLYAAGPASGLTAVIDLGWDAATLAIVSGNTVIYTRKLGEAGLARLLAAAVEAAGGEAEIVEREIWGVGFSGPSQADFENAEVLDVLESHVAGMLREISQAFGYAAHQYPELALSRVILIGGGAAIPQIAQRFQSQLNVPVSVAACPDQRTPASMISALGLALSQEVAR